MECTMIQNNEKSMSYPEPLFVLSLYFNTIQNEKMYEKNVQIHLNTSVIKTFEFDIISKTIYPSGYLNYLKLFCENHMKDKVN